MSIFGTAKEFFGLGPYNEDAAYYDDADYTDGGSTAYDRAPARPYSEAAPRADYRGDYPRTLEPAIVTATPRNYNDAKEIGEPFRDGDAVIMDLSDLDAADAKRLVDFAAGLCFALRGRMHNLTRGMDTPRRVFAITPENAPFTASELQRAARLR
ncbi:cell division protein SepF [Corynebacterium timonense]|uniref:Cell division protein SepF n=1 Tax=Corynebacterium timonense TaxID=441500 RepID=A0A1H1MM30_9CORY|nr:cell division protein SepF [Corynebacterium timonense]SDR87913.1 cell division inhibitor SepF [Corynebacterium timonense]